VILVEDEHVSALAAYEAALRSGSSLTARTRDGHGVQIPVARWLQDASSCDEEILQLCTGPTLEVGCGPGRLTQALCRNGHRAVGIDVSPQAVHIARARGVAAHCHDVFDDLPGSGRWTHVLLADGNIGIGGDPERLLRRCRQLVCDRGTIVVEVEPPGGHDACGHVRVTAEGLTGWLPWAWVSADSIAALARRAELSARRTVVTASGRYAVELIAAPAAAPAAAKDGS
jgi:SAM-dependent methyltransferase